MRRRRFAIAVAGTVAALLVGGCTSQQSADGKGFVSGDGSITTLKPADRGVPIEYSGKDLDGKTLDLASLRGKPVVINVWGTWCVPCRTEMPVLVDVAAELGESAHFVGLNTRDTSTENVKSFNRNFDVTWPSWFSPDGKALVPFIQAKALTPQGIPTTMVLDDEGRVAAVMRSEVSSPSTLIEIVKDVAAGK